MNNWYEIEIGYATMIWPPFVILFLLVGVFIYKIIERDASIK